MTLAKFTLQNFRSYETFTAEISSEITIFVGQNTAGKSNLIEAIYLLSTGKSFRIEKDVYMIQTGKEITRVKGLLTNQNEKKILETLIAHGSYTNGRLLKRFSINEIPKRRIDFAGILTTVLFSPEELDIVNSGPSIRRNFLNNILEQTDYEYRQATSLYEKALRQRNALLSLVKETSQRNAEQFEYWDSILITNGQLITSQREKLISYINNQPKDIFKCLLTYDKSIISTDRLLQYKDAEVSAGSTLVGPHRDDILIFMPEDSQSSSSTYQTETKNLLKYFGSRGQQRLAVLQLKLIQLHYLEETTNQKPLLLLDDIFSELDMSHMRLVLSMIQNYQTVITTTHEEFINTELINKAHVIKLKKNSQV